MTMTGAYEKLPQKGHGPGNVTHLADEIKSDVKFVCTELVFLC